MARGVNKGKRKPIAEDVLWFRQIVQDLSRDVKIAGDEDAPIAVGLDHRVAKLMSAVTNRTFVIKGLAAMTDIAQDELDALHSNAKGQLKLTEETRSTLEGAAKKLPRLGSVEIYRTLCGIPPRQVPAFSCRALADYMVSRFRRISSEHDLHHQLRERNLVDPDWKEFPGGNYMSREVFFAVATLYAQQYTNNDRYELPQADRRRMLIPQPMTEYELQFPGQFVRNGTRLGVVVEVGDHRYVTVFEDSDGRKQKKMTTVVREPHDVNRNASPIAVVNTMVVTRRLYDD